MQRSFIKEWLNRFRRNYVGKECERSRVVHELLRGYQQQMREEDVCFLQNIEGYSQNWRKKYKLLFSNQIKPISLKYDILFRLSIILNRF